MKEDIPVGQPFHPFGGHQGDLLQDLLPGSDRHGTDALALADRSAEGFLQKNVRGDGVFLVFVDEQGGGFPHPGLHCGCLAQNYRHLSGIAEVRLDQGIPCKTVVQHGLAGLEPDLGIFCAHHHGDQFHAVPLGGGGQTVPRPGGKAGFQPCGSVIKPDHFVGVGQAKGPVPDGVHPDGGEFLDLRVVFQKLPGHEGNIMGGGPVVFGILAVVQTGAVDKMGVVHAQFFGPGVHPLHKGGL